MQQNELAAVPSTRTELEEEIFRKWHPSRLQEWAKAGLLTGRYNLARSGIPSITDVNALPGGPFVPQMAGCNYWGHEGLKAVIARMYDVDPGQVLLAQGASQCNFLMAGAILSAGGTAIVETPAYEPVVRGIEVWADRLIRLPRRKENGYVPDPDDLRARITTDTRLVWLTNLHNPSHALIAPELLREMVGIAAEAGATVLVDEVFLAMLWRDHTRHGYSAGAVSVNSIDKAWGLDSLRVGWAVGPADQVHTAYRLNNLLGVNQPFMTEDLACRVLSRLEAVASMTARAAEAAMGRDLLDEFLKSTPQVSCVRPAAGICALLELPAGVDDTEFCRQLAERKDTTVFPGYLFEAPGTIRVGFGGPRSEVAEGLKRLHDFIMESL